MAGNKVSYKGDDRVEIVELVLKETKKPLLTVFLVNRRFSHVYEHKIPSNREVNFVAEYVRCPNVHVAAGYELATAQHGRKCDLSKLPGELRVAIMNCLPQDESCKSTLLPGVHTGDLAMSLPSSSTTKNFPSVGEAKVHTPTDNASKN